MKWSWFGRVAMALVSALALGLSMTACGGGTIAYLWVVGQQYNQINGFKVDDYTGNLTQIPGSPFSSGGANPVDVVVKAGGRYIYIVNQGTNPDAKDPKTGKFITPTDSSIAVYSVGGEGSLTLQGTYPTQGFHHLWAAFDSTGSYLFVLDKYSPTYGVNGDTRGAITAFAVDASTGRLTVVTQTSSTPPGGTSPTFQYVGTNPVMMGGNGSSCLFTLNQGAGSIGQTVTPYSVNGGQLNTVTTGNISLPTVNATSINGNASAMIITDAGPTNSTGQYTTPGVIYPYTVTGNCGLTIFTGGSITNDANVSQPVYSLLAGSGANEYLYILNASTNTSAANKPYSQITGYTVANGQLTPLALSPFISGPAPVCMVEDPTAKYMYVSNHNDGSVTGYGFDSTRGNLTDLSRGSTFQTNNTLGGCLVLSGAVE